MTAFLPVPETHKWRPRGNVYFPLRDETTTPARPGAINGGTHCVKAISLALNIDYLTSIAKCRAVDAEDARDIKSLSGEGTIEFQNINPEALALALAATDNDAEASPASVVAEVLPDLADAVVGSTVILGGSSPNFNITALSIVDSSTVPQTLVAGTNYELDAVFGMVAFGDLSAYTLPLKASYSHQNMRIFGALAAGRVVRWIRFAGYNYVGGDQAIPVDIFKAQFSPTTSYDLAPDDYGTVSLKFSMQMDLSRQSTDPRGLFFSQGYGTIN